MEFKLTERQSYQILKHFKNYRPIIKAVNAEAYDILDRYYNRYASIPKNYWFKPMSKSTFFTKMSAHNTSMNIRCNSGIKEVYSFNNAEVDHIYLRKFGIDPEPIAVMVIDAALDCPYMFSERVNNVHNMYDLLMEYSDPPFIVDDELLNLFHKVRNENEQRISVLKTIGVKYEL